MPEYLHPGVYIEEIEHGPRPIEGVATSTAAFIGETERGPTKPLLVTRYNDYKRWFGGVFDIGKLAEPAGVAAPRKPIRAIVPAKCCARSGGDNAAAVPPSSVMNSRRLIR